MLHEPLSLKAPMKPLRSTLNKLLIFLTFTFLFTVGWRLDVSAIKIEVTGSATIYSGNTGSARNQALKNALRQAVEQGVGVFIDSNTLTQNYELVKDEIFSTSEGYVSNYEVLSEGAASDGTVFDVTLSVEVEEGRIKDKLSALRILHQFQSSSISLTGLVWKPPIGENSDDVSRVFIDNLLRRIHVGSKQNLSPSPHPQ